MTQTTSTFIDLEFMADQLEELKQEQRILLDAPITVHHKCIRCGRALGNTKSMKLGFGPVCAKKVAEEARREAAYLAAKAAREVQAPATSNAPMTIDIAPGLDGLWYVIAHTPSGKAYDPFKTQAKALGFAQRFYGGTVVSMGAAA